MVARHAVRLNGLNGLAVTKLDVLTGFKTLRICTAYEFEGKRVEEVPASLTVCNGVRPIYEEFPGWDEPLAKARSLDDVPTNARRYLTALEDLTATPIFMVSVGARRQDTIILRNAFTS